MIFSLIKSSEATSSTQHNSEIRKIHKSLKNYPIFKINTTILKRRPHRIQPYHQKLILTF